MGSARYGRPGGVAYNIAMAIVLKLFWNICLLRIGPELVPTQPWFLGMLVAVRLAAALMLLGVVYPSLPALLAFNIALIGFTVLAAIIWFALYVRSHEARFPAALGAAAGAGALIDALASLGYGITSGMVQDGASYMFYLWSVIVVGFILHRALSCRPWLGVLLSFIISLVSMVIVQAALGPVLSENLDVAPE